MHVVSNCKEPRALVRKRHFINISLDSRGFGAEDLNISPPRYENKRADTQINYVVMRRGVGAVMETRQTPGTKTIFLNSIERAVSPGAEVRGK